MTSDPEPVPRRSLFCRLDPTEITLSPDGGTLAWLGDDAGTRRVFVMHLHSHGHARLLSGNSPGVSQALFWTNNHHLIVFRDVKGDENYRAFAVNVLTGTERPLTPPGARALFNRCDSSAPERVLFWINDRDVARFDLVCIDVGTGAAERRFKNTRGFSRIHANGSLQPVIAESVRADGGLELFRCVGNGWSLLHVIEAGDALASRVVGVSEDAAYLIDSSGRNTAALVRLDLQTGAKMVLASDDEADIETVVLSPMKGRPLAAASTLHKRRWQVVDPDFAPVLRAFNKCVDDGQFDILDVSADGSRAHARIEHSDRPAVHVIQDCEDGTLFAPFLSLDNLTKHGLRPMEPVTISARDGLLLRCYLTRPGGAVGPVPMVLVVHGGPYDRDRWGFCTTHQWLANRGYAVLSVNFRGSTGFGKAFISAADHEWGGRMQDDLVDAVNWAIAERIADPQHVQVLGSSYGGYAALMAGALYPNIFVGVTSIGGPSSLAGFMDAIPPYWHSWFEMIRQRLADPGTAEGRTWLDSRSPLSHVRSMRCPVLLVHGLHDVRVPPSQARDMTAALIAAGAPVTLAVFPDEGHFISRDVNRAALAALTEAFLTQQTGCNVEKVSADLAASSLRVEAGGAFLPTDILAVLQARTDVLDE